MIASPKTLSRPLAARVTALPAPAVAHAAPPASEAVIEAAFAALDAGHTHYTDRPGILPLRQQIARDLQQRTGVELSPDAVTITCGATEARFVALKQLVGVGGVVACARDADAIRAATLLIGAEVVAGADAAGATALYLTPADDPASIAALLAAVNPDTTWLLWDESAGGGAYHPAQTAALAARVVTIGSFSGALPGWRVGWLAGSSAHNRLRAFKQSMTICTTSIAQWAALGLEGE